MILMLILIHLVIIRLDNPSILTHTRIQLFLFLTVILFEDLTFILVWSYINPIIVGSRGVVALSAGGCAIYGRKV